MVQVGASFPAERQVRPLEPTVARCQKQRIHTPRRARFARAKQSLSRIYLPSLRASETAAAPPLSDQLHDLERSISAVICPLAAAAGAGAAAAECR
jgi:hypothetical protein